MQPYRLAAEETDPSAVPWCVPPRGAHVQFSSGSTHAGDRAGGAFGRLGRGGLNNPAGHEWAVRGGNSGPGFVVRSGYSLTGEECLRGQLPANLRWRVRIVWFLVNRPAPLLAPLSLSLSLSVSPSIPLSSFLFCFFLSLSASLRGSVSLCLSVCLSMFLQVKQSAPHPPTGSDTYS